MEHFLNALRSKDHPCNPELYWRPVGKDGAADLWLVVSEGPDHKYEEEVEAAWNTLTEYWKNGGSQFYDLHVWERAWIEAGAKLPADLKKAFPE